MKYKVLQKIENKIATTPIEVKCYCTHIETRNDGTYEVFHTGQIISSYDLTSLWKIMFNFYVGMGKVEKSISF